MGKTIYNNGASPSVPYLSETTISSATIDSSNSTLSNYNHQNH